MTPELSRRIWLTLGALLVYRFGTYIPLPGISPSTWEQIFKSQAGGFLGMLDMFSGGGIHRMAIFALGLAPYLSAAIILQLLPIISSNLRALRKQGERGRRVIDLYTWFLAVLLAVFQSYGVAIALESVPNVVVEPGWLFRISTVLTLTGGVVIVIWLSEWITARGLGNGVTLILFVGIATEAPAAIAVTLELGRQGVLSTGMLFTLLALAIGLIALVVVAERARRNLLVHFQSSGRDSRWHLSFKLNNAGVMPTVLASWIVFLPMAIAYFVAPGWWGGRPLEYDGPLVTTIYAAVIVGCTFFYTAFLIDPDEAAEILKRHGAYIPGVSPGEPTAEYIDNVVSRITMIGALYLALIYLVPGILLASVAVPFYLGGASLLITVCAILDLNDHIRAFASVKPGVRQQ